VTLHPPVTKGAAHQAGQDRGAPLPLLVLDVTMSSDPVACALIETTFSEEIDPRVRPRRLHILRWCTQFVAGVPFIEAVALVGNTVARARWLGRLTVVLDVSALGASSRRHLRSALPRLSVRLVSTDDGTLNEADILDGLELTIATGRLVAAGDLAPERLALAIAVSRGERWPFLDHSAFAAMSGDRRDRAFA
jgi:hypothetical protein